LANYSSFTLEGAEYASITLRYINSIWNIVSHTSLAGAVTLTP
jgi:hypothetical protein